MHRYFVELRISGATVDPDRVTAELGLQPTTCWRVGDSIAGQIKREAMWARAPGGECRPWNQFEHATSTLLDELAPLQTAIDGLKLQCGIELHCLQIASGSGAGPRFSPALIARLAHVGLPLRIETQFVNDAPPDVGCTS